MSELPQVTRVPWHGHEIAVRRGGSGPALILIHGMAGSLDTWDPVFESLARRYEVIAVDLPGHGQSSPLRGDFSLGALATSIRDVMDWLDVEGATIVGHSFGGGIALQFLYQFPERGERLVLVSAGGLGREVTPFLRALSLPGAGVALAGISRLQRGRRMQSVGRFARPVAAKVWNDLPYMTRQLGALRERSARESFLSTIQAVIDLHGQRISATDRLHLASRLPTLIVWGERDRMIPVSHARAAAELISGSQVDVVPLAGHYPHEDDPARFVRSITEFIDTTSPSRLSSAEVVRWLKEMAQREAGIEAPSS